MRFIIEKDNELDIDRDIVLEKLRKNKYIHDYFTLTKKDLAELNLKYSGTEVPVGTIQFVTDCLNKMLGFTKQNPIEIPKYLRTPEFLKREYNIVTWEQIPRYGRYFLKDASTLKHFSYCGNLEFFIQVDMFEESKYEFDTSLRLSKDAYYVVSQEVNILAEYRVYVMDEKIEAIAQYDGSPLIFPDTNLIEKAVSLINSHEDWLKSYTIDIMVTPKGTSIIEVHNFTSCGLYTTLFSDSLLLGYAQGIEYLKNDNKELQL